MKRTLSILALLLFSFAITSVALAGEDRIPSKGFAIFSADGNFEPFDFDRHPVGEYDVLIEILYAGICHSDLHHAWNDWNPETYPIVPGHEIAGRVVQVGGKVTKFKVGDYAGVGCLVNSCGECYFCLADQEQYCTIKRVLTYGQKDPFHDDEITRGGYSSNIVLTEKFAIKIPANAQMEKVAPLLCAGITPYSPIKYTGVAKGDKVAVAGFGGLGHMAVQYMVALGAEVTVFDITEDKRTDAKNMGAAQYVNVNNSDELRGLENTFSVIISTIPAKYDPVMYMRMLQLDGQLVILGLPAFRDMPSVTIGALLGQGQKKIMGSQIGGIKETQEMLDYSVANNIYPEVEIIEASGPAIDQAYKKVLAGEVKFRYVIDMSALKK